MAERVCDRRPCAGLTKVLPLLSLTMIGEGNEDQVVAVIFEKIRAGDSKESAPEQSRVKLRYCPFCGMRLEEDIIETLMGLRGK
jgi:hypothetical protein